MTDCVTIARFRIRCDPLQSIEKYIKYICIMLCFRWRREIERESNEKKEKGGKEDARMKEPSEQRMQMKCANDLKAQKIWHIVADGSRAIVFKIKKLRLICQASADVSAASRGASSSTASSPSSFSTKEAADMSPSGSSCCCGCWSWASASSCTLTRLRRPKHQLSKLNEGADSTPEIRNYT